MVRDRRKEKTVKDSGHEERERRIKRRRKEDHERYLRIQIKSTREDTYEKRNQSLYTVFRAILRVETREPNLFNILFTSTFAYNAYSVIVASENIGLLNLITRDIVSEILLMLANK